jgi:hypothetical protein
MSPAQALAQARLLYGLRAFAYEEREFMGTEKPGPDGWVHPEGPIWARTVGYFRKGKRGARLSTRKGIGRTFEEALAMAEAALTSRQRVQYDRRRTAA